MLSNLVILAQLSEGEKRTLIVLAVIFAFAFVLIGLIVKGVSYWMEIQGKNIDGYMYDLVKYGIINKPSEFRRYVWKRESKQLYLRLRWMMRLFVLLAGGFIAYVYMFQNGNFQISLDYISNLRIEFAWDTTTMFGLTVISDWPYVTKLPIVDMSINAYVAYVALVAVIWAGLTLIINTLAFIGKISRSNRVSNTSFGKNLENGVDRIDEPTDVKIG